MENGKWVFGVEHLWLLAPTRHGAHNWEGPGELTAMTALRSLAKLTKDAPWIGPQADVTMWSLLGILWVDMEHGKWTTESVTNLCRILGYFLFMLQTT